MTDQTLPDDESGVGNTSFRGQFPRNSLNDALKLAKTVHDLGNGVAIRRVSAFKELGRAPDSGPSRTLIASATRGYGLLQSTQQGTFLEPTAEGTALVTADSDAAKLAHAWQVMSSNGHFQTFVARWANKPLPIDEAVIDSLKQSTGLSESNAKACYEVFMENLNDYGLIEVISGKRVISPPEHLPEAADVSTAPDNGDSKALAATEVDSNGTRPPSVLGDAAQQIAANLTSQIQPQIAFNIQIHLPDDASPETYASIFKNISVHLLGRPEE